MTASSIALNIVLNLEFYSSSSFSIVLYIFKMKKRTIPNKVWIERMDKIIPIRTLKPQSYSKNIFETSFMGRTYVRMAVVITVESMASCIFLESTR